MERKKAAPLSPRFLLPWTPKCCRWKLAVVEELEEVGVLLMLPVPLPLPTPSCLISSRLANRVILPRFLVINEVDWSQAAASWWPTAADPASQRREPVWRMVDQMQDGALYLWLPYQSRCHPCRNQFNPINSPLSSVLDTWKNIVIFGRSCIVVVRVLFLAELNLCVTSVRVGVAMESLAVHKASVSFKFKLIGGVETRSSCSTSTCGRSKHPPPTQISFSVLAPSSIFLPLCWCECEYVTDLILTMNLFSRENTKFTAGCPPLLGTWWRRHQVTRLTQSSSPSIWKKIIKKFWLVTSTCLQDVARNTQ